MVSPLSLITPLLLIVFTSQVLAHGDHSPDELHRFHKRYALNHRALVTKCSGKVQARQLRRALSPTSSLHPARRASLLQELKPRSDNTSSSTTTNTTSSCVLDGEVTQGPYHVLGELIRQNITEGYGGIPVTYDVDFVDYSTCEPLANAWIDVWHANSTGVYSGYTVSGAGTGSGGGGPNSTASTSTSTGSTSSSSATSSAATSSSTASAGGDGAGGMTSSATDELSFNRGIWKTDDEGHFTLYSTIPGWYAGRAPHTHLKVYDQASGYQADNGTFVANSTAYHTGQWFYPQTFLAQLADLSPYSLNTLTYDESTKNAEDSIYPQAGADDNDAEVTITFIDENDITAGVIASTIVGVNLTYTSAESGSGSYWSGNITLADETDGASDAEDDTTSATDGAAKPLTHTVAYLVSTAAVLLAGAHLVAFL